MCYDGDGAEVFCERPRRARKAYKCIECSGPVPPGVTYTYISGIQDGEAFSYRAHTECWELWRFVHGALCGGHGLITPGGLREELREYDEHGEFGYWTDDGETWVGPDLQSLLDEVHDHYAARGTPSGSGEPRGG